MFASWTRLLFLTAISSQCTQVARDRIIDVFALAVVSPKGVPTHWPIGPFAEAPEAPTVSSCHTLPE